MKVNSSEDNIAEHEGFHDSLLNIEKWLMIMKQKLESFHSLSGEWRVEGRQQEAEVGEIMSTPCMSSKSTVTQKKTPKAR